MEVFMTGMLVISGLVAFGLLIYLFFALIYPEKLS